MAGRPRAPRTGLERLGDRALAGDTRLNPLAAAFALLSAASWGFGDFAGGIASRLAGSVTAVFVAQAVGATLAALLLVLSGESRPGLELVAWSAAAGLAGSLGLGFYYLALSRGSMGLVAPLTALLGAGWPAAFALLTGGQVGLPGLAGMVVALAAIVLIATPDPAMGRPTLPTYHGSRLREWALVIVAAFAFGAFYLLIGAANAAGDEVWWSLFVTKLAGFAAVGAAFLTLHLSGRLPGHRSGRAGLLVGGLAGLGDLGGNLCYFVATGEGDLAAVIVLSALNPIVTALLARLVLHERLSPLRMTGVGLAVLGVVLISLPG
jgi:drug/metabolite transporter (DMT)-like permease